MWKMWEAIPAGTVTKYKWRHSWAGKPGNDFVGFDGEKQIGRIFRIDEPWTKGKWFWLVATEGGDRMNWPPAGYEDTAKLAACRIEKIYDSMRTGNARAAY